MEEMEGPKLVPAILKLPSELYATAVMAGAEYLKVAVTVLELQVVTATWCPVPTPAGPLHWMLVELA
jgi:hypothetical protein